MSRSCFVSALWLLSLLLASDATADTAIPEKTLAELKAATVYIKVRAGSIMGSGSGFMMVLDKGQGVVVTNAHVAKPNGRSASQIDCVFQSGGKDEFTVEARLIAADESRDLALLEVKHEKLPRALEMDAKLAVRETLPVFVIGFPYGELLDTSNTRSPAATISRATVSSVRRDEYDNVAVVQVDGGINPGNSGGPVVDTSGALVGIAVAKVTGTQIGLAIPARELTEMLQGRVASISVKSTDDKNNRTSFDVRVELIDPLNKIHSITLLSTPKSEVSGQPKPDEHGHWQPISKSMKATTLPVKDGVATGKVTVPGEAQPGNEHLFQLKYTRGDKQVRLTAPAPLAERAASPTSRLTRTTSSIPSFPLPVPELRQGSPSASAPPLKISNKLYSAGIKSSPLAGDLLEKALPGPATNLIWGGGGRYIVLHLASSNTVAIFDINEAGIIKTIEVPPDALLAATSQQLFIIAPFENTIESWSFAKLSKEKMAKLPFSGNAKSITAGHASRGPLLIHWSQGTGALNTARYTLFDASMLKPVRVDGVDVVAHGQRNQRPQDSGTDFGLRNGGVYRDDVQIRASANGQVFGLWCTSHSPTGLESMVISGGSVVDHYEHESIGHIVPMADGSALCTSAGYYTSDLARKRGTDMCIPTAHPEYALTFAADGDRGPRHELPQQGTIIDRSGRKVGELPAMPEMTGQMAWGFQKGLSLDQRYICVPQAKVLVTFPSSNDRLILHKLEIDAAPYAHVEPGQADDAATENASVDESSGRQPRTWKDKTGQFSIAATFQSFSGGQVKLKKADGTIISVPLEKLCEEDATYIRNVGKEP